MSNPLDQRFQDWLSGYKGVLPVDQTHQLECAWYAAAATTVGILERATVTGNQETVNLARAQLREAVLGHVERVKTWGKPS